MADAVVSEKQCCTCKNILPASCFSVGKAKADGLAANCKACQAEYTKQWRAKNAEKIKADKKAEYEADRDRILAKSKAWREANPEKKRENDARWRQENLERKSEMDRRWRERAGESRLIQKREYQQANKEKIAEKNRRDRLADPEGYRAKARERYHRDRLRIRARERQAYAENRNGYRDRVAAYKAANPEKVAQWRRDHYYNVRKKDVSYMLRNRMASGMRRSLKGQKGGQSWLSLVPYTVEELKARLLKTMPKGCTWNDFLSGELHIDHILPISKFNIKSPNDIDFERCWALKNLRLLRSKENFLKNNKLEKPLQPSFAGI